VTAAVILAAPFVVYYVISRFIPIFDDPAGKEDEHTKKARELGATP